MTKHPTHSSVLKSESPAQRRLKRTAVTSEWSHHWLHLGEEQALRYTAVRFEQGGNLFVTSNQPANASVPLLNLPSSPVPARLSGTTWHCAECLSVLTAASQRYQPGQTTVRKPPI